MNLLDLLSGKPFDPPQGTVRKILMDGTSTTPYVPPAEPTNSMKKGVSNRERILEFVRENGYVTQTEVADDLNLSRVATRTHLHKLVDENKLRRINAKDSNKPALYTLA